MKTLLLAVALTLVAAPAELRAAEGQPRRPNIILILVDDFGYECVGANGGASYSTPRLDRMAAGGVRFTHCYAQPNCTPTRVQLMSGLSNVRNYVGFGVLDRDVTTFAHLFLRAGYATAITGKWQLGRNDAALPRHFGFEEHRLQHLYAGRGASRYTNPVMSYNGERRAFTGGEYGPDLCYEFAVDFITRNKDRPFLLYYPMILTHGPYEPTPDSRRDPGGHDAEETKKRKHFRDMVAYTDKLVGRLIDKVEQLGLSRDTLILFTGDNGTGGRVTSTLVDGGAVDGGKGTTTRTGMHTPLIAYGPGRIPGGRACHDLVDSTDFLPTVCEAAGVPVPDGLGAELDGRSFLPQLRGEEGRPREAVYSFWVPLREWQRARVGRRGAVEQAFDRRYKLYSTGHFFDLDADPNEESPLAAAGLRGEAAAARTRLQAVLDRYAAVPAAKFQR
jgi:arylsulfatase A